MFIRIVWRRKKKWLWNEQQTRNIVIAYILGFNFRQRKKKCCRTCIACEQSTRKSKKKIPSSKMRERRNFFLANFLNILAAHFKSLLLYAVFLHLFRLRLQLLVEPACWVLATPNIYVCIQSKCFHQWQQYKNMKFVLSPFRKCVLSQVDDDDESIEEKKNNRKEEKSDKKNNIFQRLP